MIKGAVRARYADLSAAAGDTSGRLDEDRLQRAVADTTRGVLSFNGGSLIAPERGMRQEEFDQLLFSIGKASPWSD
jgi:hypothetical protein